MYKVAVIGASGYMGGELLRLLSQHPKIQLRAVTSEQSSGKRVTDLFPNLSTLSHLRFEPFSPEKIAERADLIFASLPHKLAQKPVAQFIENGKRVVDLSADYRFKDAKIYEMWYTVPHDFPALLKKAVYGLPEFHRAKIKKAKLIGNPGCYATAALLGITPLVQKKVVQFDSIIVDAKSGISGAGRSGLAAHQFTEANEGLEAYQVGRHRHLPEIEQELKTITGHSVQVTFTPHLIPLNRGILCTIYAKLNRPKRWTVADLTDLYQSFYKDEPFIQLLQDGASPNPKYVRGSNFCQIGVALDSHTQTVIVMSALDNLGKGGAGQAVQNMNLMLGLSETEGLSSSGVWP
jgi:N-acetyl-gamma-glutamyl-phosphate reductase